MKHWALFLLGIAAFSAIGSMRNMADGWPSDLLSFVRVLGCAIIFRFIIFPKKLKPIKSKKMWLELSLIGVFMTLAFTFYLDAFSHANIADVKLIGFLDPILVLLFSGWFLHETAGKFAYISAALAVIGLLALAQPASATQIGGLALGAIAMFFGAGMVILIRHSEYTASISQVLIYPFFIASALLFLKMIFFGVNLADVNLSQWPWALAISVFTAIGYYSYDLAMKAHGAHIADLGFRIGISILGACFALILNGQSLSQNWWIAILFLALSAAALRFEAIRKNIPYEHRHHGHTH